MEESFENTKGKSFYRNLGSRLLYVAMGVILALAVKQGLSFALSSDMPVVAVLTESMQHDNVEYTHYQWLENTYGYSEEYIDSWSVPTGFLVGDMPVIKAMENACKVKTPEGIGIGSTEDEIIKAYGEPSRRRENKIFYKDMRTSFGLAEAKVIGIWLHH